jgi:hypothetical protein
LAQAKGPIRKERRRRRRRRRRRNVNHIKEAQNNVGSLMKSVIFVIKIFYTSHF